MNKKCILTICLAAIGVLGMKAQNSIVALHHEGKVTLYAGSETQTAMDASVKGDTLYLSEGVFGGFNVTHGIVVLGSGINTLVSGNITITGNDENKNLGDYVFCGLNLMNDFVIADSVHGFKMEQCQMQNFKVERDKFIDAATINMSYIPKQLTLWTSIHGLEVINTKIGTVSNGGSGMGAVSFYHCNIKEPSGTSGSGDRNTYVNCIVHYTNLGTYVNCIYSIKNNGSNSVVLSNCWRTGNNNQILDEQLDYKSEYGDLDSYIGTDGTVVGITGGVCPYTLEVFTPHVVEHTIDVDNVNATLKVTLKMAGDANQ